MNGCTTPAVIWQPWLPACDHPRNGGNHSGSARSCRRIQVRERTLSAHRKLDVKEMFCLCGFAFFGFALWLSLVPETAAIAPVNPMVTQAMRLSTIRTRITQLRQQRYQATGDYAQAVLSVAPDVENLQQVMHQTSAGWNILSRDP